MGKLIQLSLSIAMVSAASAQSAANFDTRVMAPTAPTATSEPRASKPVPKEAGPVSTTPARNIGPAEMESYVASMSSVFLSRSRAVDPFGQHQDPDSKPLAKATTKTTNRPVAIKVTPFPEIIAKIQINTIMPSSRSFLIASRTVKQGSMLPLSWRGKTIRTQVVSVTAKQIDFRNLETGETASRAIDVLPVGMTPGSNGITAPGMTPHQPDAPLELDAGDYAP
jgi:hypothetical protein